MNELIFRNLEEIIGRESLEVKIANKQKLLGYVGFAPTGQLHIGYLIPCMKIRDLTLAGCDVTIMLADLHAMLDNRKTPSQLIGARSEYYRLVLTKILTVLGANLTRIKFVRGSDFQRTGDYFMDVLELSSRVLVSAAKKAGSEVVKQSDESKLGSAIYPVMQAIDENYVGQATFGLQVDFELGGIDQRKIFCFSRDWDNCKISYLMTPNISLGKKEKMSSSNGTGKIIFYDNDDIISTKIEKSFCSDGDPSNGLVKLMQCVFFPLHIKLPVLLDDDKYIGYSSYREFEKGFVDGEFVSFHLKTMITRLLCQLMEPIRDYLLSEDMRELMEMAYPPLFKSDC